uniref:Uncharacterized protein n=1 Tax=Octactis speculum TaxID=3111310 RepID=A0A7S2DPP5_9STRA
MTTSLASGIQGIQDLLPGMDPLLCEQVNNESPGDVNRTACTLFDLKYHYTGTEYYEAMFYSPLQYSQFFAEAFMLQYTSGLEEVAWGQLGDDVPKELSSLYGQHVALMTLVANRWTSLTYGSQLLGYIVAALAQSAGLGLDLDGLGPVKPSDSILLLFAHDTNQAYLREMLELTWFIEGWPMDSLATGGVLSFELVQDENRQFVMVKYTTATPQQQHDATPLDSGTPPSEAYLIIPECGTHQCPFDEFQRIALSRLSMSCVSEPLRTTLEGLQQQGASAKNSWGVRTVYKSPNPRSMALLFFAGVVVAMMSLRIGAVFKRSCARGWQRNRERAATASMYVRYHDLPSQMTKHDASVVSTKITLMRLGGSPLQ